jgi:phosphonate transport system substrate-binding protein
MKISSDGPLSQSRGGGISTKLTFGFIEPALYNVPGLWHGQERATILASMIQRKHFFSVLKSAVTIFALCLGVEAQGQIGSQGETKTLSLGVVSEVNRAMVIDRFRDFVVYLARRLAPGTNIEGKVILAPTPFQLVKLIEQKRIDFFLESAYPTYIIDYLHGVGKPILRRWKSGMAEYQSLIFSGAAGIKRLEELRGNTIAFEDPGSTSGYLLPKLFLLRSGFKLLEKPRFDPDPSPNDVRYVFAYSQEKLLDLVLTRQAAAGAISNDDLATLDDKTNKELIVLARTEKLPRHLVSVRLDLGRALASRLEKILLVMHEENDGRRILKQIDNTTKFDALPDGEPALRRMLSEAFSASQKK